MSKRLPHFPSIRAVAALILALCLTALGSISSSSAATEKILYSFAGGSDGSAPYAGLLMSANGTLYGTTLRGGTGYGNGTANCFFGCGTVFALNPPTTTGGAWTESQLYAFANAADGAGPAADLFDGPQGVLYSTTSGGGSLLACSVGCSTGFCPVGCGTAFQLIPPSVSGGTWTKNTIFQFNRGNGAEPSGGFVAGPALYGMTETGSGAGTVYGLTSPTSGQTSWGLFLIHVFTPGSGDGSAPMGNLLRGADGKLYGTASGASTPNSDIVFSLTPPPARGGAWTETILHKFNGGASGDGAKPEAGLVAGPDGALYGTTSAGGTQSGCCGTVFSLTPPATPSGTWTETILYAFTGGADGASPEAALIIDSSGALYGTTSEGGTHACSCGTVFKVSPPALTGGSWTKTTLYSFAGGDDGAAPQAKLTRDQNGNFYGTTKAGGAFSQGTVFEVSP